MDLGLLIFKPIQWTDFKTIVNLLQFRSWIFHFVFQVSGNQMVEIRTWGRNEYYTK